MVKTMVLSVAIIIPLCLLMNACGRTKESGHPEGPGPESAPPEGFELRSGDEFNADDFRGKILVLDLWATWCGPCKMEIPDLIRINDEYKDRGVVLVGITFDDDAEAVVPKYAKEVGMNYVNFTTTPAIEDKYNVAGLPTKIIYDADGKEVFRKTGYMSKAELVKEIEKHLAVF